MGISKKQLDDKRDEAKGKQKRGSGKVPFADIRFVRIELTSEERDNFRSLMDSGEFEHISVDDFVGERYKVSFSSDGEQEGVLCSVTMAYADHHNGGLVLTGRGRSAVTALAVAYYKSVYLCTDSLWREAEASRGGSYRDIS